MALILKAVSYKGIPPLQEISARFDNSGGTLGRSPDNHLVLPDPEKYISRLHASIVFQAGQYYLQDNSTGGTFLVDTDTLLQQGRTPLHHGQRLRIGEYELQVELSDSAAVTTASAMAEPVRHLDLTASSSLDDPFGLAHQPEPAQDFFSSFMNQADSSPIHQSFSAPDIAQAPPPAAAGTSDELDLSDLLFSLDALSAPRPTPATAPVEPQLPELPADFFAEEVPPADAARSTYVGRLTAITDEEPALPEFSTSQKSLAALDPFASPATTELPEAESHSPAPEFPLPMPGAKNSPPTVEEPIEPIPAAPVLEAQASAQLTPSLASAVDNDLIREFLAGAGICDSDFVPPEQWASLMRTSGELLRAMVEGLMQVLRARAELKSQFRVSVTTMRSVDNNPLKFTPNPDDAIKLILAPTNPGFLPPKAAVREGFNDIMNHQMAMTAGIQASLAEILQSFDPDRIEKSQSDGILFQKKAKCWDYYTEKYPQLRAVAQEEFFGDAFADAYEKQMLLLGRASKTP